MSVQDAPVVLAPIFLLALCLPNAGSILMSLITANKDDSMCQLFVSADPRLWQNVTRSIRIDGMVTSIRLETIFWFTLEEIAERDQLSLAQMIVKLNHEALQAGHDLDNFTSFLRVCAMRYVHLQSIGMVPSSVDVSLTSLNSERILAQEKGHYKTLS